jgi:hypothetical protein
MEGPRAQYCSQMLHMYHTYHILARGSEMNMCCTILDIILKWSGFKLQMWTQNAETSITTAFQRPEEKRAERAKMNNSPCSSRGQRQGARPSRDTSHGLHSQGKSAGVAQHSAVAQPELAAAAAVTLTWKPPVDKRPQRPQRRCSRAAPATAGRFSRAATAAQDAAGGSTWCC